MPMPDPNARATPEPNPASDQGDPAVLDLMEAAEDLGRAPDKRPPPPPEEDIPDDEIKMPTILP